MTEKLTLYSIMPLDLVHIEELCEDIRKQYEDGVTTCPLFMMTLVPEGTPPVDKAGALCEIYRAYKTRLDAMGIPNGVLVQASIGHGYRLGEMFPYQRYVNLTDGAEASVVCPYDEGFRAYISDALETIARCAPDHIMVDDDFRLLARPGRGCACPVHMARFAERSGKHLTREELYAAVCSETEDGLRDKEIFIATQGEALLGAARAMREGVDRVDSKLPMSYCCCGRCAEFAEEIAAALAGEGNPVVIRINNAYYSKEGAKILARSFERGAVQIAYLKEHTDRILAETDTCPQNRYSTSAASLHAHFTGSILEGAGGAKQWITRLSSYEPSSGRAFRTKLAKYRDFYEELARVAPTLRAVGCRIPLSERRYFDLAEDSDLESAWNVCALGRMGIPLYFSAEQSGAAMMDGKKDRHFTDDELLTMLSGAVFLSSDSAEALIRRGFGRYLGVDVREWNGLPMNGEMLSEDHKIPVQVGAKELVPTSERTEVCSWVYNTKDKLHFEQLFPASVYFENELGGKIVTFCGTPKATYTLAQAYSFLNEPRKAQIVAFLQKMGELPVYCVGDEEIYLRAARMEDGGLLCAVFDLGFDPLEEVTLWSETPVCRAERLMPNGAWESVAVRDLGGGTYALQTEGAPLDPVVLRLYR